VIVSVCHSSVNHFHRDRGLYAVCMLCVKAGRNPAGVQYIGVHWSDRLVIV